MKPLILPEAILSQARAWRDEACALDLSDDEPRAIGQPPLISPITGAATPVVLQVRHFGSAGIPRGKIVPRIRSLTGDDLGEGFTIILNIYTVRFCPDIVIHVLLHEIIHALDPLFLEDVDMQQGLPPLNWTERLHLKSEQRAFSCMWIEQLRGEIASGQHVDVNTSIVTCRGILDEFDGFYCAALMSDNTIVQQTVSHFEAMVNDLRTR